MDLEWCLVREIFTVFPARRGCCEGTRGSFGFEEAEETGATVEGFVEGERRHCGLKLYYRILCTAQSASPPNLGTLKKREMKREASASRSLADLRL